MDDERSHNFDGTGILGRCLNLANLADSVNFQYVDRTEVQKVKDSKGDQSSKSLLPLYSVPILDFAVIISMNFL